MILESCNYCVDGVMFGFYGVMENALAFLFLGSVILLTENIDGGVRELDPDLCQNFDHGFFACGGSLHIETS